MDDPNRGRPCGNVKSDSERQERLVIVALIIARDLAKMISFEGKSTLNDLDEHLDNCTNGPILLYGNRLDVSNSR